MCARYYPRGSGWNSNDKKRASEPVTNDEVWDVVTGNNELARWVYTAEWNDENLLKFEVLYSVQPTRGYLDYLLDRREDAEYLARYGITPGNIRDPRKLRQTSSGSNMIRYGLNFVSDNIKRLYH